jgi:hypothetical protein
MSAQPECNAKVDSAFDMSPPPVQVAGLGAFLHDAAAKDDFIGEYTGDAIDQASECGVTGCGLLPALAIMTLCLQHSLLLVVDQGPPAVCCVSLLVQNEAERRGRAYDAMDCSYLFNLNTEVN